MTRGQRRARILRWAMLVLGILLTLGGALWLIGPYIEWGMGLVATPLVPWMVLLGDGENFYAADLAFYVGLFLLMQWFFLRPRKGWHIQLAQHSRSMKTSIIAAACMAMLLTIGALAALLELVNVWEWIHDTGGSFYTIWAAMLIMWIVWGIVFYLYWRQGDRYTRLGKMIRGLMAGSVLEMLLSTAVYAWNPQNEDCYCARGSYTGLILGGTVLLWCFGPGIVLLFIRERYRASSQHKQN